ncbi:hypothetical protein GOQ29_07475 [Clostridium sp. D2Q-14]|uniref:nitroreductase family protein n=1 Tax=Anaeromonas gelatinilytica TaxID=2683194 RepID=UPI00193C0AAA|nr:nitroreductase family protein [Anaeromonas gelatinilytica]MBS4535459.1 hypothetical protein [Anaeromonas gelatinilytica]
MLFSNFLKSRHSIREYQDRKVEDDKLESLIDFSKDIKAKYNNNIEFIFYKNGEKIYDKLKGIGGYSGVMIKSPHYIGLQTKNRDKKSIIKSAYAMENLLTEIYKLKLGSCWINIMNVSNEIKELLFNEKGNNIDYIVAIGYPKRESKISKITDSDGLKGEDIGYLNTIRSFKEKKYYVEESTSSRLSVKEIVYDENFGENIDVNKLEERGLEQLFYYVRYAPSNKNKQPWRFILKDDRVELVVLDPKNKENLTDIGIIMYYFEQMAKNMGLNNTWDFIEGNTQTDADVNYSVLGEYKL